MNNISDLEYMRLEEAAKKCMRISAAIVFAVLTVITAAVCLLIWGMRIWVLIAIGVPVVIGGFYTALVPMFRYDRYRYRIDDEAIRVRAGFIFVTEQIVPMERLHKLSVSQGPVDRIFKLSTIKVTTAGGDAIIQFLPDETAAEIAETLKKKINDIAMQEREKK